MSDVDAPFCGPYTDGAPSAHQRVVDIAREDDLHAREPRVQPVQLHGGQPVERAAAVGQDAARVVEEAGAERGEHPGAAVGARAAADPEHDPGGAGVERGPDKFAGAAAAGAERIGSGGQQHEPGRRGQLDDGGPVAQGERAAHAGPGRAAHLDRDPLVPGGDGGVECAVPAVGHRQLHGHRPARAQPGCQASCDFGGGGRALELVRRHQDVPHQRSPISAVGRWRSGRRRPRPPSPRTP